MKLVRAFCLLDIVVTAWLALPGLANGLIELVFWVDGQLGLGTPMPEFAPLHWLMINLAGALGVLWNTARLRDASGRLHHVDAWARLWVGGLILAHVLAAGVTPVMLAFVATEVLGSASHFATRHRARA